VILLKSPTGSLPRYYHDEAQRKIVTGTRGPCVNWGCAVSVFQRT